MHVTNCKLNEAQVRELEVTSVENLKAALNDRMRMRNQKARSIK